jgi:phage recombination protein Bet
MTKSTTVAKDDREGSAIVVAGLSKQQVALIKRTICEGYSDDELRLYLYQCENIGLDPLAREAYTFKAGGKKVVIGITIDGFRRRADETGMYSPGRPTEYTYDDNGQLDSARVWVRKRVGDEWFDVCEDAYLSEFRGPSPNWKAMPRVMLSKCAEARALRRAFPAKFSGLYSPEERYAIERDAGQADRTTAAQRRISMFRGTPEQGDAPIEATAEVVDAPTPETPYTLAIEAAREMGASNEEIQAAQAEVGIDTVPTGEWQVEHGDMLLGALERMKGA